jgi:hypothetical protein
MGHTTTATFATAYHCYTVTHPLSTIRSRFSLVEIVSVAFVSLFLPPNIESSKSTFSSNTNFQRVPLRSVRSTPSRTLSAPDAVSDLSIARRRLAPLADTPPPRSDPTTGVRRPSDDTPPVPVECDLSSSLTESSETVSATRLPSKLTSRLIKN